MTRLKTVCCCCGLRAGSMFAATYSLLSSAVFIALLLIRNIGYGIVESSIIHAAVTYGSFVLFGLLMLVSVGLIIGVHKENRWMFVPWLVQTLVALLFATGTMAWLIVNIMNNSGEDKAIGAWEIALLTFHSVNAICSVYFIICVVSLFREIGHRRQSGSPSRRLIRRERRSSENGVVNRSSDISDGVPRPPALPVVTPPPYSSEPPPYTTFPRGAPLDLLEGHQPSGPGSPRQRREEAASQEEDLGEVPPYSTFPRGVPPQLASAGGPPRDRPRSGHEGALTEEPEPGGEDLGEVPPYSTFPRGVPPQLAAATERSGDRPRSGHQPSIAEEPEPGDLGEVPPYSTFPRGVPPELANAGSNQSRDRPRSNHVLSIPEESEPEDEGLVEAPSYPTHSRGVPPDLLQPGPHPSDRPLSNHERATSEEPRGEASREAPTTSVSQTVPTGDRPRNVNDPPQIEQHPQGVQQENWRLASHQNDAQSAAGVPRVVPSFFTFPRGVPHTLMPPSTRQKDRPQLFRIPRPTQLAPVEGEDEEIPYTSYSQLSGSLTLERLPSDRRTSSTEGQGVVGSNGQPILAVVDQPVEEDSTEDLPYSTLESCISLLTVPAEDQPHSIHPPTPQGEPETNEPVSSTTVASPGSHVTVVDTSVRSPPAPHEPEEVLRLDADTGAASYSARSSWSSTVGVQTLTEEELAEALGNGINRPSAGKSVQDTEEVANVSIQTDIITAAEVHHTEQPSRSPVSRVVNPLPLPKRDPPSQKIKSPKGERRKPIPKDLPARNSPPPRPSSPAPALVVPSSSREAEIQQIKQRLKRVSNPFQNQDRSPPGVVSRPVSSGSNHEVRSGEAEISTKTVTPVTDAVPCKMLSETKRPDKTINSELLQKSSSNHDSSNKIGISPKLSSPVIGITKPAKEQHIYPIITEVKVKNSPVILENGDRRQSMERNEQVYDEFPSNIPVQPSGNIFKNRLNAELAKRVLGKTSPTEAIPGPLKQTAGSSSHQRERAYAAGSPQALSNGGVDGREAGPANRGHRESTAWGLPRTRAEGAGPFSHHNDPYEGPNSTRHLAEREPHYAVSLPGGGRRNDSSRDPLEAQGREGRYYKQGEEGRTWQEEREPPHHHEPPVHYERRRAPDFYPLQRVPRDNDRDPYRENWRHIGEVRDQGPSEVYSKQRGKRRAQDIEEGDAKYYYTPNLHEYRF